MPVCDLQQEDIPENYQINSPYLGIFCYDGICFDIYGYINRYNGKFESLEMNEISLRGSEINIYQLLSKIVIKAVELLIIEELQSSNEYQEEFYRSLNKE